MGCDKNRHQIDDNFQESRSGNTILQSPRVKTGTSSCRVSDQPRESRDETERSSSFVTGSIVEDIGDWRCTTEDAIARRRAELRRLQAKRTVAASGSTDGTTNTIISATTYTTNAAAAAANTTIASNVTPTTGGGPPSPPMRSAGVQRHHSDLFPTVPKSPSPQVTRQTLLDVMRKNENSFQIGTSLPATKSSTAAQERSIIRDWCCFSAASKQASNTPTGRPPSDTTSSTSDIPFSRTAEPAQARKVREASHPHQEANSPISLPIPSSTKREKKIKMMPNAVADAQPDVPSNRDEPPTPPLA
ncbi:hypothetical protein IV203_010972 [Nitzschia inconspicua]|uniref:Uncharacterized protein n=1 Tax=Nitzschia inconspicua TaxID=303405 RepID=A0A9K3PLA6_9STRA|nr:hypothetical protein IV203_010972 [Nitzschia inconspicua]